MSCPDGYKLNTRLGKCEIIKAPSGYKYNKTDNKYYPIIPSGYTYDKVTKQYYKNDSGVKTSCGDNILINNRCLNKKDFVPKICYDTQVHITGQYVDSKGNVTQVDNCVQKDRLSDRKDCPDKTKSYDKNNCYSSKNLYDKNCNPGYTFINGKCYLTSDL